MSLENDTLGFIAAFLTTTAFVPQAYMVWRTNNTEGVSLGMYGMTVIGIALWLVYGIVTNSMPLMISCSCTFMMSSYILWRKIQHTRMLRPLPDLPAYPPQPGV